MENFNLFMSEAFYRMHYERIIGPNLSGAEKTDLAKRISEKTLRNPIWLDKDKDYTEDFPELKPYINVKLSGLYLCAILKGLVTDLQGTLKNE